MPQTFNYDDNAFSFFAITLLTLYVVPASCCIVRRVRTFKPPTDRLSKVRTIPFRNNML